MPENINIRMQQPPPAEMVGKVTRRGMFIANDGKQHKGEFGPKWHNTAGDDRYTIRFDIGRYQYSGIVLATNTENVRVRRKTKKRR